MEAERWETRGREEHARREESMVSALEGSVEELSRDVDKAAERHWRKGFLSSEDFSEGRFPEIGSHL